MLGDSFGTKIVERLSRKQLASQVIGQNEAIDGSIEMDAVLNSSSSDNHTSNASAAEGASDNNTGNIELQAAHTSHNTTKL